MPATCWFDYRLTFDYKQPTGLFAFNVSASARGAERSSAQAATKEKNSQPWPALAVAVEVGQRFVAELIKVSAVDRGADVV